MLAVPWRVSLEDQDLFFCTPDKGWENLTNNLFDLLRYTKQTDSLVTAYEKRLIKKSDTKTK